MIAGIMAKATFITAGFKRILFRHYLVSVDESDAPDWDFLIFLFHASPPFSGGMGSHASTYSLLYI